MIFSRIVNRYGLNVVLSTSSHLLQPVYAFPKHITSRNYSVMEVDSCVNMELNSQRTYQVVVAATGDMGIGKNGKLPWNLPSDLTLFKKLTSTSDVSKKKAVIMGRKTWESIPLQYRPLPDRLNVMLTRSTTLDVTAENFVTCNSVPSALELFATTLIHWIDKVFVIGGGQILREAMNGPRCEAIHVTEIATNIDCDTFIPPVDMSVFSHWYSSLPVTEDGMRYRFVTYVRLHDSNKLKVENFDFLPKIDKHED